MAAQTGCYSHPEQRMIERPDQEEITNDDSFVDVPEEGDDVPIGDEGSPPEEDKRIPEGYIESGSGEYPKGSAGWAVVQAQELAREWSSDARLFGVQGNNLILGKITDAHGTIRDVRTYQARYIVSFISESLGNQEILEIQVDWGGAVRRSFTRGIPSQLVDDHAVSGWAVDSTEASSILEEFRPGLGYSVKSVQVRPVSYILALIENNQLNDRISVYDEEWSRSGIYRDFPPGTPIGSFTSFSDVVYDIDLAKGELVGYYSVR